MRILITALLLLLVASTTSAQSSVARLKYEQAEEAFLKNDLAMTLTKLDEVQAMLGETNPKILYLRIMAQSKLLPEDSAQLPSLKKNCALYLKQYDGKPGLEDKYKEVFLVSEQLLQYEPNADFLAAQAAFRKADYTSGINLLKKAGLAGYGRAANQLGNIYLNGSAYLPKDVGEAIKWYQRAVDKGNPVAMYTLGYMHRDGIGGLSKNNDQALALFKSSAEGGYLIGMQGVADPYYWTLGNVDNALPWYRKCADKGDAYATGMIGSIYYHGGGSIAKDLAQAKAWFEKAGAKGDPESLNYLGVMYKDGHHVTQNYTEAYNWFVKARDAGSFYSWGNLADLYEAGNGVAKDKRKAAEYRDLKTLWKEYALQWKWKSASALNSVAWGIYEKSDDPKHLDLAIRCIQRSLELKPESANTDTYAALLFKTGNFKEALVQEEKAIALAKGEGKDTKEYEAFLLKIRAKL